MKYRRAALLTLVAIWTPGVAAAAPGSCASDIVAFQQALKRQESADPAKVGTAPQTIAAQLEHQPTPQSVLEAQKSAKFGVEAAVREAKALNAQGKDAECEAALAKARLLLDP